MLVLALRSVRGLTQPGGKIGNGRLSTNENKSKARPYRALIAHTLANASFESIRLAVRTARTSVLRSLCAPYHFSIPSQNILFKA